MILLLPKKTLNNIPVPKLFLISFLLLSIFQTPPCLAKKAERSFDLGMSVEPYRWVGARLKNLKKGTLLKIDIKINGHAKFFLLNSANYANFPSADPIPLFSAKVQDKLFFSVSIPSSENYYLVIDNRQGKQKVSFKIHLDASLDLSTTKAISSAKNGALINRQLSTLSTSLRKALIFNQLDIKLVKCGKPNAYSDETTVYLCIEYVKKLRQQFSDKSKIQHVLFFTLMHEIGHVLLRQWDYPFYDNEEVADEFASVIFIMFNQRKIIETQAKVFANIPSDPEYKVKQKKDSRHPISIQRARNLKRWLNDSSLLKKWQSIFIPHMQTAFLKRIIKQNPSWANKTLTNEEINHRQSSDQ